MQQATLFDLHLHSETERITIANGAYKEHLDEAYALINELLAENRALQAQVRALESENSSLRLQLLQAQVTRLVQEDRALRSLETEPQRPALVKALTHLAAEVHPDRHGGSAIAEECTKAVLRLRDSLSR